MKLGSGAGAASGDGGMFAGIFMMLNAEAGTQTQTGKLGLGSDLDSDLDSDLGPDFGMGTHEDSPAERAPEETAALVAAMIQPSADKKGGQRQCQL